MGHGQAASVAEGSEPFKGSAMSRGEGVILGSSRTESLGRHRSAGPGSSE